jgi:two-component system sensor histidine kinase UhpB
MWKKLSLRTRLSVPMIAMVVAALALGGIALQIVTPDQFIYENAQTARSTRAVADALTAALAVSENPQATLDAFAASLGASDAIQFCRPGQWDPVPRVRVDAGVAPQWFISLLRIPDVGAAYPVAIGGARAGAVVFRPNLSADVFEKWIGFLAIVLSGSTLMLLAALSAYFTTGSAIRPLDALQQGLTRLRRGDYGTMIPTAGPPEIRKSCEEANELARTLKRLSQDNRGLLRKIVSLQDDERRELARELHDELGPLLFAIRANATALAESADDGQVGPGSPVHGILQAGEALQQANRRILEGLSPLYVGELGLEQSLRTLLRNAQAQAPHLEVTARLDTRLNRIDGLLSQTAYRVIQEGVTNVLRHAQATHMEVDAGIDSNDVAIAISDDGIGFPAEHAFGRGLTGMHERVRALNGTFEVVREDGRTLVRCRLPIEQAAGIDGAGDGTAASSPFD